MIKGLVLFTSLAALISCSQVNTKSKDYYTYKSKIRHGIIPQGIDAVKLKTIEKERKETYKVIFDQKLAMKGKRVYRKHCLSCHGPAGLGDGADGKSLDVRPVNLQRMVRSVPNFKFYISVSQWTGDMPGWKKMLTEKDIIEVTHYIKSLAANK